MSNRERTIKFLMMSQGLTYQAASAEVDRMEARERETRKQSAKNRKNLLEYLDQAEEALALS